LTGRAKLMGKRVTRSVSLWSGGKCYPASMTDALRMPDRVLVDRLLAGDPEAADLFVTRFNGLVWAILVRSFRLRDDQREDLFQEVFVRLWEQDYRRIRMWSGDGDLASYLAPIVRHLALDRLRRSDRREQPYPDPEGPAGDPASGEPDPLELAWVQEQRDAVDRAVDGLIERDRELYRLRYEEQATYEEISRRLAITVNNVGVRLARLTERLRKAVGAAASVAPKGTIQAEGTVRFPSPGSSPE
jgi:RNA polymerase sigma factor (sigma-70 family)